MAQYGESNGNRMSGYGSGLSGQSGTSQSGTSQSGSSKYGSSGGSSYQSGYRGDNRRDDDDDFGRNVGTGSYSSGSSSYGSTGSSYGSGQYGSLQSYESGSDRDYSGSRSSSNYGSASSSASSSGSSSGIAIDETHRLIGSDKVEGTAVYDRDGERIGTIHNFMVDKRAGKVEYAVMSFGGFLGMGQTYYPLPWQMLDYDTDLGGFRVEMDEEDLDHAPSFRAGGEPDFDDQYSRQVYGYYGFAW